jgi:hypothetical protein
MLFPLREKFVPVVSDVFLTMGFHQPFHPFPEPFQLPLIPADVRGVKNLQNVFHGQISHWRLLGATDAP